ncbi:MAG: hypothetical protein M1828_002693 [Chrysothrix sp. TS-e1954]|nr:MAG: hypothetical protein M1828_002693 [Chrysothrix sp. TS-e1954]
MSDSKHAATPVSSTAASPYHGDAASDTEPEDDAPPPAYNSLFPPRQSPFHTRSRSQPSTPGMSAPQQDYNSPHRQQDYPQQYDPRGRQYNPQAQPLHDDGYDVFDRPGGFGRRRRRRQGPLHQLAGMAMSAYENRQSGQSGAQAQQEQQGSSREAALASYGRSNQQAPYAGSAQAAQYGERPPPEQYGRGVPSDAYGGRYRGGEATLRGFMDSRGLGRRRSFGEGPLGRRRHMGEGPLGRRRRW